MANQIVNRQVNIFIESGQAQKALDTLIKKENDLKAALDKATDPKKAAQLKTELDRLQEPIDRARKKVSGELAPSFNDVKKTVNDLGNRLKRMSIEDSDYSKTLAQWKEANSLLDQQKQKVGNLSHAHSQLIEESSKFGKIFERTLEYVGAYEIINKVSEALRDLFVGSIEEATQAEEATARFKATLDNLGRTEVFDRLKTKADELAAKFKYIDNDEIVAVFEKLIDYGKLTEEQINQLTPVIINFAAKQRIPIEQATDLITKALEGNARALKTFGINLTEATTPAERLKIVMTELKDKVDGAAEAFGETTAGKVAIAKQSYKDLKEEIGNNLLPALNKLLEFVNGAIKGLPLLAEQVKNTMSDVFTFFTSGPGAVQLAKVERLAERMKEIEGDVIQQNLSKFEDKSAEEVHAEIDRINLLISVKNSYIKTLQDAKYFDPTHFTKEDQKNLDDYTQGVRLLKGTLDGLYKLQDQKTNNTTLGNGDPNYDPTAAKEKEAARKRAEEQKKNDQKRLDEELLKLSHEYLGLQESDYMKELQAAFDKFQALKDLAHGNAVELQKIETGLQEALSAINKKYADKALEAEKKLTEEKKKIREKELADQLKKGFAFVDSLSRQVQDKARVDNKNRTQAEDLEIAKSTGKQKLQLQLQQLREEEQMEIAAAEKTGASVELIHQKYLKLRQDAEAQFFQNQTDKYLAIAQTTLTVLGAFDSIQASRESAQLERDRAINEKKKANLDKRLKAGAISQQQYDNEVQKIEQKQQKREQEIAVKQFKRKKLLDLAQAAVNGAIAITNVFRTVPPVIPGTIVPNPEFPLALGLAIASTAAQVAIIAAQKPPQYARGGKLFGRSHAQGGLAVVDSYGNKQAEVEGGEGITNKRTMADRNKYSVSGTPSEIISGLNALHGGVNWSSGSVIRPLWAAQKPRPMNFATINSSLQTVKKFAGGGVFENSSSQNQNAQQAENNAALLDVIFNLNKTLADIKANGINGNVYLNDIEKQQARKANLLKEAGNG